MSETAISPQPGPGDVSHLPGAPLSSDIDRSCRFPLLFLFASAAVWLVIASGFGLIASIKFHSPAFLADHAALTFGRIHPASTNALTYGFGLQAGIGVGLWLFARLGRTFLAQPLLVVTGIILMNLGVTLGTVAVLAGESTGFELLEMPWHAALLVFIGYLIIGTAAVATFHQRREAALFPSQWFLLTALFWFPWIYSTANMLLVAFPVRGVAQAVIAWWFANNLNAVWMGLVGIACLFYFTPKLAGRDLHSYYLALLTYWLLILLGSWGGIPATAPVPAWMPTLSTISAVIMFIPLIAVALNVWQTSGKLLASPATSPSLAFVLFGTAAFLVSGLMKLAGALLASRISLEATWYASANALLQLYGFFAMALFGGIYYLLPKVAGELPFPRLVRAHFWVAAIGSLLLIAPLAGAGIRQALSLSNANIAFVDIAKSTLPFLRVSTLGDVLLLIGHLLLLTNVIALILRLSRVRVLSAYTVATADLFKTAEAKP